MGQSASLSFRGLGNTLTADPRTIVLFEFKLRCFFFSFLGGEFGCICYSSVRGEIMLRLSPHLTITSLNSEAFSFSSFQDKTATLQQMLPCVFKRSVKVLIVRCFTISPFVSGRLLLSAVPGWHIEANVSPLSGVRPIIPSSLSELCVSVLTFAIPSPCFRT